ncbi:sigma-70 family RNA polymerase sigma factor [Patulibacter sp. SYSU D01012]|uniref:sigma-70 family RNA polymerase sigma factor n=1 Tax=Patulibacter sp. SYSU D01012 TaxID=2817381 RepID=UPI001B30FB95|nr:sigma-70 family RNA polymerase sigma factor [Patulibacter sp. SYSU D01012]
MTTLERPGLREDAAVSRDSRRARRRADEAIAAEYDRLRPTVRAALAAKLARGGMTLDDADLDAAYNQAWHTLHAKLAGGERIDSLGGFLTQAAYYRSVDEYRRMHPDRHADLDPDAALPDAAPDVVDRLDDERRLREVVQGLRERLGERERKAAALCYLHGLTRREAAAALGVSPPRMEKIMDGVSRTLAGLVGQVTAGRWCEEQRSLVTAYALDVLDPEGERMPLALAHLRGCPGCRALVRQLRGLSALVPPVGLPWLATALGLGAGGTAAATSASAGGSRAARSGGRAAQRSTRLVAGGAVAGVVAAAVAVAALQSGRSPATDAGPATASASVGAVASAAVQAAADAGERAAAQARADARAARRTAARRAARERARAARARERAASAAAVAAEAAATVAAATPAAAVPPAGQPASATGTVAAPAVAARPPAAAASSSATPTSPVAAAIAAAAASSRETTDGAQEFDVEDAP